MRSQLKKYLFRGLLSMGVLFYGAIAHTGTTSPPTPLCEATSSCPSLCGDGLWSEGGCMGNKAGDTQAHALDSKKTP